MSRLPVEHRMVNRFAFEVSHWFLKSTVWFSCLLPTPVVLLWDPRLVSKIPAMLNRQRTNVFLHLSWQTIAMQGSLIVHIEISYHVFSCPCVFKGRICCDIFQKLCRQSPYLRNSIAFVEFMIFVSELDLLLRLVLVLKVIRFYSLVKSIE